ncbi:YgiQ family radical SAM protein [Colwellia sp. MB02u-18]|uniref:YgiQ family radical SAM protein n=1 Tax=unclassified Colwellia TaxID=196834 RepID=UPI0015F50694|nr:MULTISPECIES: YgiQ family radical SAM protein [unclassified Colwellia]MBA6222666.1 YgiQ family radical SAM protein [Colwellia sp. MB3u-45]MBA6266236.1 YgiQ family radical SAM protein [Colwellia sp. MB3u-43]MBA6322629.1 YgiQ family radical SAM protein [Colwellia sp. MB02u-19]MBA6326327.1 YgiQ family radical SAM protein [Colwellia sp. MB02u-18]MBA6332940.1 YgiQ family radical SAM protein [Colwellia sp. MB02u-12]
MNLASLQKTTPKLFDYPKYWAECYGTAPFLPMSRQEMEVLGWDSCDIILVTGDAYVDHPSFGMAVIGRMLESQGFRVGIIAQPDWHSKDAFMQLGKPNLFFGVTAGNMDSMINRYTAERRMRHDDAYTPNDEGGKRPDRAVTAYTQKCKEAYKGVPIIIGGIEASLRRVAHYDYWSDKVRQSVLFDSKADLLIYGNAERPLIEIAHRIANGDDVKNITDVRGSAFLANQVLPGWKGIDSRSIDKPGKIDPIYSPYQDMTSPDCATTSADAAAAAAEDMVKNAAEKDVTKTAQPIQLSEFRATAHKNKSWEDKKKPWETTYINLPTFEQVRDNKTLYAHASRIFHQEVNPTSAKPLVQKHGSRLIWLNPPAKPLSEAEMDGVFGLPYQRVPHPIYGDAKIPAYDMIKTSINIMRGCFGGCTFCSITEHEGRIIQSRSEDSIIAEIEDIKLKVPGFTGVISDLGGPTANMYKLNCKSEKAEATCRKPSCVWPTICGHLDTDHTPTINLYRRARKVKGIKKILIASGVRYDLAIQDPEYVKELATHHVGGYLKIAPEHTEEGPLNKMMKPGMGSYNKFKEMFDHYSKLAGKKQYLIPYFISAHPGTTDLDMVNLALWLKENDFKLDQVQNFYPSPLANATTLYHTEIDSLRNVKKDSATVSVPKGTIQRRLHKAILRYHDPANWGIIRDALTKMGLARKLIGSKPGCLVPNESRNESQQVHFKNNGKGKNNAQGNKTSPGQEKRYGKKPITAKKAKPGDKAKQGLTRFSDNQFNDRKPKKGQIKAV